MIYIVVKEQPGLLVKIYQCFNKANYRIRSHKISKHPSNNKMLVTVFVDKGDLPINIELESALLNIKGCLDIVDKEPLWLSPSSKVSPILDNKIKNVASVIVNDFENIENIVNDFISRSDPDNYGPSLFCLGNEVGTSVYNIDYALGKPLKLEQTLKRMLSNAMKKFGSITCSGRTLTIDGNILCCNEGVDSDCDFTKGFITGFLHSSPSTKDVDVLNYACRSHGQSSCSFEFK